MASEVKLNHEVVLDVVGGLGFQGGAVDEARRQLENATNALSGAWEGVAANSFVPVSRLLASNLQLVAQNMSVFSGKLSQADAVLTDQDLLQAAAFKNAEG